VLWITQTLSLFGTFVSQFAVNIWLTVEMYPRPADRPALALALTAATLASTAPLILAMPLAGAFADRHDRRRVMLAANAVLAALTSVLVALSLAHALALGPAVVLLAGYSCASAFHSAAFDSSYGLVVPESQMGRASGMMQTSYALSQVLAPALAATLIGLPALLRHGGVALPFFAALPSGVPFAFAADALTFAIAAATLAILRLPLPPPPDRAGASVWADVRVGVDWIVHRRPFLWLMSFGSLANLTFAPLMLLLPLLVRDRIMHDPTAHRLGYEGTLALANMSMGLGGIVGGVAMSVWGGLKRRRVYGMVAAMVVLGLGQAVAGLATSLWLMAAGLFLAELLVPALNAHSFLLWQELTPPELLARALSTRRFIAQVSFPIGAAIAGWIATGAEPWVIVVAAGLLLAAWCAAQLATPAFATLEDRLRAAAASPAARP
jgi:MFS family permease